MPKTNPSDDSRRVRLDRLLFVSLILLLIILIIGIIGFRYIVNLTWIDSFQNAAFYISGMGPVAVMETIGQKLFAGTYSIISGILYLAVAAYLISQIVNLEFFQDNE
jgi:hypothetical protein